MPLRHHIKTFLNGIEAKFITHHVSVVLGDQGLTLADVGAAGAIEYRWKRIEPLINYIGFEPDERSYKNLITKSYACQSHLLHQKALWSTNTALEFKVCEGLEQSSNFSPNYELVDLFPQQERFNIEKLSTLHACTLDQLVQNNVDFIKIDAQGGELAILQGATARVLDNVLGMELELGIAEIYSNQPLFGDILKFIETQEFVFIDFVSLRRWERNDLQTSFGQLVFGDGLFLRSPEYMAKRYKGDSSIIRRYLAICCLYNRYDLIEKLDELVRFIDGRENIFVSIKKLKSRSGNFRRLCGISNIVSRFTGSEFKIHGFV